MIQSGGIIIIIGQSFNKDRPEVLVSDPVIHPKLRHFGRRIWNWPFAQYFIINESRAPIAAQFHKKGDSS